MTLLVFISFGLGACIAGSKPVETTPAKTSTETPVSDFTQSDSPLLGFPLSLGCTWVYSSTNYDTLSQERITVTYIITDTVVSTQIQPPYFIAEMVRDRTVVKISDSLVGKDWTEDYLAGMGWYGPYRYVISGTHIYRQRGELDLSKIESSQEWLEFVFPLVAGQQWYPDFQQRVAFPNYEIAAGLRTVQGPIELEMPAGKFETCFLIVTGYTSGPIRDWFCLGIGAVGSVYHHGGTPFGYEQVLVDYFIQTP